MPAIHERFCAHRPRFLKRGLSQAASDGADEICKTGRTSADEKHLEACAEGPAIGEWSAAGSDLASMSAIPTKIAPATAPVAPKVFPIARPRTMISPRKIANPTTDQKSNALRKSTL